MAGLAEEYRSDNHSRVDATFTDGAFFPVVVGNFTYRLASSVHAEWHAEFFSPGLDGFRDGTFDHVDDAERTASDPAARSSFFFGNAHVGIDLDGNDQVDDNENIDVVGGRIAVGANGPRGRDDRAGPDARQRRTGLSAATTARSRSTSSDRFEAEPEDTRSTRRPVARALLRNVPGTTDSCV